MEKGFLLNCVLVNHVRPILQLHLATKIGILQIYICVYIYIYIIKSKAEFMLSLLSHPSLGWPYVFSSYLRPSSRPRPLPLQRLLLLTSKPFQLNLRYLGQRKYRSGKMYWMTFWWPWPKVMAVTLINRNFPVCRTNREPLNQSLQIFVAISLWSCLSPD